MATTTPLGIELEAYKWGFHDPEDKYVFKARKGLDAHVVNQISHMKGEPDWMRAYRLHAYDHFTKRPTPKWGADLGQIDFDDIYYYLKPTEGKGRTWEDVPADIKRTFDRLGIPEAEKKYLAGVGAQYECLTWDARVYTARGLVPIREVEPGDTVFSFDEPTSKLIPARVKSKDFKGEREVFEVRVGTHTIRTTGNHPFLVLEHKRATGKQRGRYSRTWKYLHELKVGDLVAVAKRLPDVGQAYALRDAPRSRRHIPVSQPQRSSTDLMWWLGLYLGDGFLHREGSKARVELAIPRTDEPLRREFGRVTQELFGVEPHTADQYRVTVGSTVLARYVETNGFSGGALTKSVPDWVFGLPQDQKLAFLGGFVDADGYVRNSPKNHDVVITSGNKSLLQDLQALAAVCGVPTSRVFRFESKHPKDTTRRIVGYRMQLAGDFEKIGCRSRQRIERFGKRRHHHDYSSAGGSTFRIHTNEFVGFRKIKSITPAGIEPVYDIEVDGPHNFVAEGLIVHNSESVYHNLKDEWEKLGVIFLDTDSALKQHPDIVKEYFGTVVPPEDNKLAALNSAVWSGGSFVYVPEGVHVDIPLQAYFRINAEKAGQFERTLIICEPGSYVHYVEGCTAPTYVADSLHSAVVEIIVKEGARCRYTTIQNWSMNTYNLVTKRAVAYRDATMEWIDGNIGSKLTMKYPSVYMVEPGAKAEILSVAYAGKGQHQDPGGKVIHAAPHTQSSVVSKSISKDGGRAGYRGLVKVYPGAYGSKCAVRCDALILDEYSRSDTYPTNEIEEEDVQITHEATVSKVSDEQLFYLMARGIKADEAMSMIVRGFIEPIAKELPLEYSVELNRLIALEMEGSVG
jgi:FeS assembly protein SufB